MFEHLAGYRHIVVTGPQRGGTRICAKMIAADLDYIYVDECIIDIDSLYRTMEALSVDNVVVQAPALCRYAHMIGYVPDTAIVMMRRNVDDIIASQERIGWEWESTEKLYYVDTGADMNLPIAEIKYQYWDQVQAKDIPHAYEIEYRSLSAHPMWIDKPDRVDFAAHQTETINA